MDFAELLEPPWLSDALKTEKRDPGVWHVSSLGRCVPEMMLAYFAVDLIDDDLGLAVTRLVHDGVRDLLAAGLEERGLHPDTEFPVDDKALGLLGHADVIWDGGLLDVKTANPWTYNHWTAQPEEAYWWDQLEGYCRLGERDMAHLFLVDRSSGPGTGRWHVFEHRRSDDRWDEILARLNWAALLLDSDEMPDNDTVLSLAPHAECSTCRFENYCLAYNRISEFVEAVQEGIG